MHLARALVVCCLVASVVAPGPPVAKHDSVVRLLEDKQQDQLLRPRQYLAALAAALRDVRSGATSPAAASSRAATRLLQRMGDTALFLRQFNHALDLYREAHEGLLGAGAMQGKQAELAGGEHEGPNHRAQDRGALVLARELLASHAAMAKALRQAQRFVDALDQLAAASRLFSTPALGGLAAPSPASPSATPSLPGAAGPGAGGWGGGRPPGPQPSDPAGPSQALQVALGALSTTSQEYALLAKMRSQVLECAGDYPGALRVFEEALVVEAHLRGAQADGPTTTDLRRYIDLLDKVVGDAGMVPAVQAQARLRLDAALATLLARGPWTSVRQLPATLLTLPGLVPTPWFTPGTFPQFGLIVGILEEATSRLGTEFWSLWHAHLLTTDVECIHNPTRGKWRAHSVDAPWQLPGATQVASAVVASLRDAQSLPVIRAEYSALEAGGYISPHYGMTNGQVKFHLGVVVPSGSDGAPCAFLTVDGDRRPWHLGKVLIFDDSFKHHVDNHCTALRAVFQVVVVHPAVVAARGQASRRSEL